VAFFIFAGIVGVRSLWFDQRALLAQDAGKPEIAGGPETHAFRDPWIAEAMRATDNPFISTILNT
jgi:hypothetical protein